MPKCPQCGKEVSEGNQFCGVCGALLPESKVTPAITRRQQPKSESTTLLLAVLPAIVGFQGVGHLYLGRLKGLLYLLIGLLLIGLIIGVAATVDSAHDDAIFAAIFGDTWEAQEAWDKYEDWDTAQNIVTPLAAVAGLGMFLFQVFEARRLVKEHNRLADAPSGHS